jgi:transposase
MLEGWVSRRNTPQKLVWRARIVLLSADRVGVMTIARSVGKSKVTVGRWQERYLAKGIAGLARDATRPGRKLPLTAAVIERVESGCGAVAVGRACLFPPLSSGGALVARP